MAKGKRRTRDEINKFVTSRQKGVRKEDIHEILDQFMDSLREMEFADFKKRIGQIMGASKKHVTETFKPFVKGMADVIPKGKLLETPSHTFKNSAELNAFMRESLKHKSFKGMSPDDIEKFYKKFDDKLDLPDASTKKYLKIDDPDAKIYKDGNDVYQEIEIADSIGARQGGERQYLPSRGGFKDKKVQEGMERAHSAGQGLGIDSPYGVYFAPKVVNQAVQNSGIEAFIGTLHATLKKEGKKIKLTTRTTPHTGTHRLKEIAYKIDIVDADGNVEELMQYGISVGNNAASITFDNGPMKKLNKELINKGLAERLNLAEKMADVDMANGGWKKDGNSFLAAFFS